MGRTAFIGLGLCLSMPTFAAEPKPKADDKDNDKVERRVEAEANLPEFHRSSKEIRSSSISKNDGETKGSLLHQSLAKPPRVTTVHRPFETHAGQQESTKSTRQSSANSKVLAKLDSLAQTQDRVRQRSLYGFKADQNAATTPLRPVPSTIASGVERVSSEKPALAYSHQDSLPQAAINKTSVVPNNAAIGTRNDSVPHRGPGPGSLGGPASVKNTGINGTELRLRR